MLAPLGAGGTGCTCRSDNSPWFVLDFAIAYVKYRATAVAQWLRYCATNRKVAVSIPDGVIGIFD
jgi:hypothetical protein